MTISGGGNSRVSQVDGGVTASLSGLTISRSPNSYNIEKHKKVIVIGTMTISGYTVTGNSDFDGAGFYNASTSTPSSRDQQQCLLRERSHGMGLLGRVCTSGGRNSFADADTFASLNPVSRCGCAQGENPNRPGPLGGPRPAPGIDLVFLDRRPFPERSRIMSVSSWLRNRSACQASDSRPKLIALVAILFRRPAPRWSALPALPAWSL